jgi:hypothetical protein
VTTTLEHAHHRTATFTITAPSHAQALLDLRDQLILETAAIVRHAMTHGWQRMPPSHTTADPRYNNDPDKPSPARWAGGTTLTLIVHLNNHAGQRLTCHCQLTVTEARWFSAVNAASLAHATRDTLRDTVNDKLPISGKRLEAWREISWRFTRVTSLDAMSL